MRSSLVFIDMLFESVSFLNATTRFYVVLSCSYTFSLSLSLPHPPQTHTHTLTLYRVNIQNKQKKRPNGELLLSLGQLLQLRAQCMKQKKLPE